MVSGCEFTVGCVDGNKELLFFCFALENKLMICNNDISIRTAAQMCIRDSYETVCPAMEDLRAPIDKLEMIVDKEAWPMPSYGDLIFEV